MQKYISNKYSCFVGCLFVACLSFSVQAEPYWWEFQGTYTYPSPTPQESCQGWFDWLTEIHAENPYSSVSNFRVVRHSNTRYYCLHDTKTRYGFFPDQMGMVVRRGDSCEVGSELDPELGYCVASSQHLSKNLGTPEFCAGNPINIATGNKFQAESDYTSQSLSGLSFVRYYNSQDVTEGVLGVAWRHGYERYLIINDKQVKAVRPDGRIYTFDQSSTGWSSDPDVIDRIALTGDGWSYITSSGVTEHYDANGHLITITERSGRVQSLSYNPEGRLANVTDAFGRALQFEYDNEGRLIAVTDPAGANTTYEYSSGRLSVVTYPDGGERYYYYDDPNFENALTSIVNGEGDLIASWVYNDNGWAVSSTHASGADNTNITYNDDDTVTVTNPLGRKTTYHFKDYYGVPKVVKVEGHATANCAGANKAYIYDGNGFVTSKTDWNGIETTYEHDAHGLELSRTEAAGTPEARTITTEWDAERRLPLKRTEPGRITVYDYDAQGRLLGTTVQPR